MTARHESSAVLAVPPDEVFAYVDDPQHLAAHMARPSWAMAGGEMQLHLDEGRGREVGAHMRLSGQVLGLALSLDEVVTERTPPRRKTWQTVGSPRLLVMGPYRMGFTVTAQDRGSLLRVFIEYALPERPPGRWLGCLFAPLYARWCTARMVSDAVRHFQPQETENP